jgi:hypothetical protein
MPASNPARRGPERILTEKFATLLDVPKEKLEGSAHVVAREESVLPHDFLNEAPPYEDLGQGGVLQGHYPLSVVDHLTTSLRL